MEENSVRKFGIIAVLIIALASPVSVDAGLARRQYCEDDYQKVFYAAGQAVHDVGAIVFHSDSTGGTVVGRIEAEVYGHTIEINVWIDRDRDGTHRYQQMWVRVKAEFRQLKDPDEEQLEQLEIIENHVFGFIASRTACGPPQ